MAYRRTTRKRVTRKPKSWYSKKYSVSDIAQKALAGVKAIRGIINSERHITDTSPCYSGTVTSAFLGQTSHLTNVTTGDLNSNRTGLSILAKSMHLKGFITWNTNTAAAAQRVCLMLVQDLQQISDGSPAWSDFYSGDINSFPNKNSAGRFKVLSKRFYNYDHDKAEIPVNMYVKLNCHVKYNGINDWDIQKNGIFLIAISNHPTFAPSMALNSRFTFYDN